MKEKAFFQKEKLYEVIAELALRQNHQILTQMEFCNYLIRSKEKDVLDIPLCSSGMRRLQ